MNTLDCVLIGHNEQNFEMYERNVRRRGTEYALFQELSYGFVKWKGKLYTISDLFNELYYDQHNLDDGFGYLSINNRFSLTIAYLASYLHKRNYTYDYVNTFQTEKEILKKILQENKIRLVAISTTLYFAPEPIREIISFVRKYNKEVKIVLGGQYVMNNTESYDEEGIQDIFKIIDADYYINNSKGEEALTHIIDHLQGKIKIEDIDNIYYRSGNKYISTKMYMEDIDLDENIVDWSVLKRVGKYIGIRTSTSCPFSCKFCEFPKRAGKYKIEKVESIEKELDSIKKLGTVTSLEFIDDTLNVPVERFKEILKMMIRNKYNFKWNSFARCQFIDEEIVKLMKESGCEQVVLGIESGSQYVLDQMNKSVKVEQYRDAIRLFNKYDIISFASIVVGYPGETKETVQETIDFLNETKPTYYRAHPWFYSILAPISKETDKYGIKGVGYEWSHNTMNIEEALELMRKMYFEVKDPICLPQYNFNTFGSSVMLARGLSRNQVANFLRLFNEGITDKFLHDSELSDQIVEQMRKELRNIE